MIGKHMEPRQNEIVHSETQMNFLISISKSYIPVSVMFILSMILNYHIPQILTEMNENSDMKI